MYVQMPNSFFLLFFSSFFLVGFTVKPETAGTRNSTSWLVYNTSVVLDVNSKMGAMANICLSMALRDFYAQHPNYRTRLSLQRWDSLNGVAEAASSEYLAQGSVAASFSVNLGESPSPSAAPYLIRTGLAYFSRMATATVSILEKFERNEVILIYEEDEYGNAIVPYLIGALQNSGIQLSHKRAIPTYIQDFEILEEMEALLIGRQSKAVFVVHMSTTLASRLLYVANKAGMMSKGYTWIVTDGLSNFVGTSMDSIKDSVIGVRPYVPQTKALHHFKARYKRLSQNKVASELNIFGLWVYDTVWALAMSLERILGTSQYNLDSTSEDALIFEAGPRRILEEISNRSLGGISGDIDLVNGELQPLTLELFNLTGKGEKIIGYWITGRGISRNLGSARLRAAKYLTSRNKLKIISAPKDTRSTLKKNDTAMVEKKLMKIWILKNSGFREFVNIDPKNYERKYGEPPGFSIEVFEAIAEKLELHRDHDYKYVSFGGTYDELCCHMKDQDVAVYLAIVANRTNCVDFTLPYLQSGVAMLIKDRNDGPKDMWIFLKPLSWDLWLTIICICIFIGIVVRFLDRRQNTESEGSRRKMLTTIFTLPCVSVAIPQRDMVATNYSRMVLVLWIFLAFILMQSYTANLSSILTVNQLQPTIPSIKQLKKLRVGYQNLSFVRGFLLRDPFGFNSESVIAYNYDDYEEALFNGSENGGVTAIFDEIPYIRLFLSKHTTGYRMVGPIYRTDGLGFAFPRGSQLVANFSREILNYTQGPYMSHLMQGYFGKITIEEDVAGPISSTSPSLTSRSFAGLFIIVGIVLLFALVVSESQKYIFRKSNDVSQQGLRVQPTVEMSMTDPPEINNIEEYQDSNKSDIEESTEEGVVEVHSP